MSEIAELATLISAIRVVQRTSRFSSRSTLCVLTARFHAGAQSLRTSDKHPGIASDWLTESSPAPQGSSREHAALAPRSLGLHLVIAKGVARIHWQNLVNFGVLPLIFMDAADYDRLEQGDVIRVESIHAAITSGPTIPVKNLTRKLTFVARHSLSDLQVNVYMAGGLINWKKARL